jgi:hypothetical protein
MKIDFFKKKLKFICIYLLLAKLMIKKKFSLVYTQVFYFYFEQKKLFKNDEKFRNIILFANYIKFDPQTFD